MEEGIVLHASPPASTGGQQERQLGRCEQFVLFAQILLNAEGLEVEVVEAESLLALVGQIKLRARDDVVDVPDTAVVGPRHAILKLPLKVATKFGQRAADVFDGAIAFLRARSL
jgi:hypothetical protein